MDKCRLEPVLHQIEGLMGSAGGSATSDGQLLERFADQHDSAALELIVRRHGRLVWNACRRVLMNDHDAEDAFQATFLVLVRRARSLDRSRSIAGWLYGVARRVALRARANAGRRRQREQIGTEELSSPAGGTNPELREFVDSELDRLPEKYRLPLILCYLEGKTHEEAARELGWPLGTLKSRILRGRARLQRRLGGFNMTLLAGFTADALRSAKTLPVRLAGSTVTTTVQLASGAVTQGFGSLSTTNAVALAREVCNSMWYFKVKMVTVMGAAILILAGGIGVGVSHRAGMKPEEMAQQSVAAAEPAKVEQDKKDKDGSSSGAPTEKSGLDELWTDLGSTEESTAMRAMLKLAALSPKDTLAFLKEHVAPVKVDQKRVGELLTKLDAEDFAVREKATQELEYLGEYAVPFLERALADKPALEARQRIEALLPKVKPPATPVVWLRCRRAIAVLETINTDESRKVLEGVSQGRSKALPTQDAEAALDRLAEKPNADIESRWTDLSGKDEGKALAALLALAASPKDTVSLLKRQVDVLRGTPTGEEAERLKKLVDGLGADDFQTREKSMNALIDLGPRGIPYLKEALKKYPDLETDKRLLHILQRLEDVSKKLPPGGAPVMSSSVAKRATALLEHIDTPDARAVLKELNETKEQPVPKGTQTATSPDGRVQAIGGNDGKVCFVDAASSKLLAKGIYHKGAVLTIAYSPDGKIVASGGADGMISLIDAQTGKLLRQLTGHAAALSSISFSPDGEMLTSVDNDKTEHQWDLATGKQIR